MHALLLSLTMLAATTPAAAPATSAAKTAATSAKTEYNTVIDDYGQMPDGTPIQLFTIKNSNGATLKVTNYGAIITELDVPDREGKAANVVLSADSFAALQRFAQTASVKGRVANRIAGAHFTLDGKDYTLAANDGANTLHGGRVGFDRVAWKSELVAEGSPLASGVEFTYVSKDGEEGFPGNLTVSVTYTLTAQNTLRINYTATTDQPTPVNLTNHAFFNLTGGRGDSSGFLLQIYAHRYTVADAALIPTGEIKDVAGTPLDFTAPLALGTHAAELPGHHYDHSFVLDRPKDAPASQLALAARVTEPTTGRIMEVWTTEPGLQLYTSNLNTSATPAAPAAASASASASAAAGGTAQASAPPAGRGRGAGRNAPGFLVLETQHFPDAVHHDNFPSIILRPGQTFQSTTEYRFSAK